MTFPGYITDLLAEVGVVVSLAEIKDLIKDSGSFSQGYGNNVSF